MTTITSRLQIALPTTSDTVSQLRLSLNAVGTYVDQSLLFGANTLNNRPAANTVAPGYVFYAYNVGALYVAVASSATATAASSWIPLSQTTAPPIGTMMEYTGGGSSDPADPDGVTRWVIANGRTLSRTTYAALNSLYSASSYPYGSGDGSTTFGIPNMAGLAPVGAGSNSYGVTATLGTVTGAATVTLTSAQSGVNGNGTAAGTTSGTGYASLAGATTGVYDAGHAHNQNGGTMMSNGSGYSAAGGSAWTIGYSSQATFSSQAAIRDPGHTHGDYGHTHSIPTLALNARNADSSHNNVQPSMPVNYIIRVQ